MQRPNTNGIGIDVKAAQAAAGTIGISGQRVNQRAANADRNLASGSDRNDAFYVALVAALFIHSNARRGDGPADARPGLQRRSGSLEQHVCADRNVIRVDDNAFGDEFRAEKTCGRFAGGAGENPLGRT